MLLDISWCFVSFAAAWDVPGPPHFAVAPRRDDHRRPQVCTVPPWPDTCNVGWALCLLSHPWWGPGWCYPTREGHIVPDPAWVSLSFAWQCISALLVPTLCLNYGLHTCYIWCMSYVGLESSHIQLFLHNPCPDSTPDPIFVLRVDRMGNPSFCIELFQPSKGLGSSVAAWRFRVILGGKKYKEKKKAQKHTVGVLPMQEGGELPDPSRCFLSSLQRRRMAVCLEQQQLRLWGQARKTTTKFNKLGLPGYMQGSVLSWNSLWGHGEDASPCQQAGAACTGGASELFCALGAAQSV